MSDLGDVEILLDGKPHTLRCTLRAAKAISAMHRGFTGAFEGLSRFEFSAYVAIVAAGLDKRASVDVEAIESAIYKTGLPSLSPALSRYVDRLANGGKDPAPNAEAESGNG